MNAYHFDTIGWVHFISALLAMFIGGIVLLSKKGTQRHIYLGYVYAVLMFILNISAFMIYRLTGSFGPFHIAAILSTLTLVAGILPVYLRKPEKSWLEMHYELMSWSIIGLYAAFWSETFSRFFRFAGFWVVVITASVLTFVIGFYLLKSKKKKILSRFTTNS